MGRPLHVVHFLHHIWRRQIDALAMVPLWTMEIDRGFSRMVQGLPALGQRRPRGADPRGKGDIPLVRLKWQCASCRSGMTDFVVTGTHFGPSRADLGKIGSQTEGGLKPCCKPAGRTFTSWNMIQPLMPFLSASSAAAFGGSWRRTLQS